MVRLCASFPEACVGCNPRISSDEPDHHGGLCTVPQASHPSAMRLRKDGPLGNYLDLRPMRLCCLFEGVCEWSLLHDSSDLVTVLSRFNFSIPRPVLEKRNCIFLAEKADAKRAEGRKFDVRMHLDQYFFDSVVIKICTHEFSQGDSVILALDFDLSIGQNLCRDASRLNKLLNRGAARLRDYIASV